MIEELPKEIYNSVINPYDLSDVLYMSEFEDLADNVGEMDKMDLEFISKTSMWLYAAYDSGFIANIIKNKEIIKECTLYESPNTAIAITNKPTGPKGLIRCTFDISQCFDTFNIKDMKLLQDYYQWLVKKKRVEKSVNDAELLKLFMMQYPNYKSIRTLYRSTNKITPSLKLPREMLIVYKIIDTSCIGQIEKFNIKS